MELIEIKIRRYPQTLLGVKLYETEELLYIINNPVDYVLDGVSVLPKRYIKHSLRHQEQSLKHQILEQKMKSHQPKGEIFVPCMKDFIALCEKKQSLVEVGFESQDYVWIGKVIDIADQSFTLETLDAAAKTDTKERIFYDKVRFLAIETDYLCSLGLVIA